MCVQNKFWFSLQNWPFKIFSVNSTCNAYLQFCQFFMDSDKTKWRLIESSP